MKYIFVIIAAFLVSASKITPINESGVEQPPDTTIIKTRKCTVEVFRNKAHAETRGPIIEKCFIEGSSAPSWSHTVETAIKKHAPDACKCEGATNVYVYSSVPMTMTPAKVKMVAFKYAEAKQNNETNSLPHLSELNALESLRNDGIITETEFRKQKAEILARH